MGPPRASASYKKKAGTMTLSQDMQTILWIPMAPPGAPPSLSIRASTIEKFQQTPPDNPRVMLKVFTTPLTGPKADEWTFSFTSPTAARAEAGAIIDAISPAIKKVNEAAELDLSTSGASKKGPSSASLVVANAVSVPSTNENDMGGLYNDSRLKSDVELQQSLLITDPFLRKTLMESLRTKPDSIGMAEFTTQFWSTRVHLLRAHAIEKNQTRGAYNVLATIKTRTEDTVTKLSISKEQIQLIFNQHPLVRRVYDENVPKSFDEAAFWSRFFLSRLHKKVKGEKIVDNDPLDPIIDRYLREEEDPDRNRRITNAHIPHIIDIQGNEENHPQRKGNQPDLTMRPAAIDKVPIIRTLNTLSERIMATVTPVDGDPSKPIGMDEETYRELVLRDLQADDAENRIILNIKDQQRFFSDGKEKGDLSQASLAALQDPAKALMRVRMDLENSFLRSGTGGADLDGTLEADEDSDEEDGVSQQKLAQVGSKASLSAATTQIFEAISQRRSQDEGQSASSQELGSMQSSTTGLSPGIWHRVSLTHATSTEFLHHFWAVFLSGDQDRANELAKLAESLDRAVDRIEAVARDAEEERKVEVEQRKKEVRDMYQTTGKKIKFKPEAIGGGSEVVHQVLGPTIKAIGFASTEYKKALSAEARSLSINNAVSTPDAVTFYTVLAKTLDSYRMVKELKAPIQAYPVTSMNKALKTYKSLVN
ncbi:MAG: General transcription factor IIH subunit 1 [Peltula sp. TS41687]|nr:MAG: General transcription factor IIH subunit 1 [Peltula sp. TS41687]